MAAYVIATVDVQDWERYRKYMELTPGSIAQYGGRFVVRGGQRLALEGPAPTERIVILEFPSLEQARIWYESPEYTAIKKLRAGAATARFVAFEGCD